MTLLGFFNTPLAVGFEDVETTGVSTYELHNVTPA